MQPATPQAPRGGDQRLSISVVSRVFALPACSSSMIPLMKVRGPLIVCLAVVAAGTRFSAQIAAPQAQPPMESAHRRVDELFSPFKAPGSPGCAVSVTRDGVPVLSSGYGLADIEHGVGITPQTAFYAASVSKQFAAAAIGLLILRGQLSPDANVRELIPEVPDYGTPITIRHLLHHTSGLRDYLGLQGLAGWPEDMLLTERDFLAMVGRQRGLNFAPGAKHLYSNTGYVLLSLVVRKVSGLSLREFAAKELFGPLGMTHTVFRDSHTALVPGRAPAYARLAPGGYRTSLPGFDVVGDGGLFTTAGDLAKWNPLALDRPLNAPGLSALLLERGRLSSGETIPYAMGLRHDDYRGLNLVRHGGSYGGYRAEFVAAPSVKMTVALLCNLADAGPAALSQRILDIYVGDQLGPSVAPTRPGGSVGSTLSTLLLEVGDLPGTYFSDELDVRWTVQPDPRNGIALQRRNLPPMGLASRDQVLVRFTAVGGPIELRFERDASGRVTGFVLDNGDITGIRFAKLPARQPATGR